MCLLEQGLWLIKTHAYECIVSRFLNSLGSLKTQILDVVTMETTREDKELIIKVNQGTQKLDDNSSLTSTLQASGLGTRVDNTTVQNNPSSRFVLILHNKDTYDIVTNFQLHGAATGSNIRIHMDNDMERFPMYELMRRLL